MRIRPKNHALPGEMHNYAFKNKVSYCSYLEILSSFFKLGKTFFIYWITLHLLNFKVRRSEKNNKLKWDWNMMQFATSYQKIMIKIWMYVSWNFNGILNFLFDFPKLRWAGNVVQVMKKSLPKSTMSLLYLPNLHI